MLYLWWFSDDTTAHLCSLSLTNKSLIASRLGSFSSHSPANSQNHRLPAATQTIREHQTVNSTAKLLNPWNHQSAQMRFCLLCIYSVCPPTARGQLTHSYRSAIRSQDHQQKRREISQQAVAVMMTGVTVTIYEMMQTVQIDHWCPSTSTQLWWRDSNSVFCFSLNNRCNEFCSWVWALHRHFFLLCD